MLWLRGAKALAKLIIRVINFKLVQPICSRYINVTDRQTNGRTTYDSSTAHCTIAPDLRLIVNLSVVTLLPYSCRSYVLLWSVVIISHNTVDNETTPLTRLTSHQQFSVFEERQFRCYDWSRRWNICKYSNDRRTVAVTCTFYRECSRGIPTRVMFDAACIQSFFGGSEQNEAYGTNWHVLLVSVSPTPKVIKWNISIDGWSPDCGLECGYDVALRRGKWTRKKLTDILLEMDGKFNR